MVGAASSSGVIVHHQDCLHPDAVQPREVVFMASPTYPVTQTQCYVPVTVILASSHLLSEKVHHHASNAGKKVIGPETALTHHHLIHFLHHQGISRILMGLQDHVSNVENLDIGQETALSNNTMLQVQDWQRNPALLSKPLLLKNITKALHRALIIHTNRGMHWFRLEV